MAYRLFVCFVLVVLVPTSREAAAQVQPPVSDDGGGRAAPPEVERPEVYTIDSLQVVGVDSERMRIHVLSTSGLTEGQQVTLPGGTAIADAVRAIYGSELFSDVQILTANRSGGTVDLILRVTPEPALADYSFRGVDNDYVEDLREKVPLLTGRPARPGDIQRTKQIIKDFYAEEGYRNTSVRVQRTDISDGGVTLTFYVDEGRRAEIDEITILGNETLSDGDVVDALDEIREDRWWRFWSSSRFDREKFEADLQRIVDHYNAKGYYDARIVSDSVYLAPGGLNIDIKVHEGPKFYISRVEWEGNTVYPDQTLTQTLGLRPGDAWDGQKLQENLYGAGGRGNDVMGLYQNRGYLRANVQPNIRVVGGDSLALVFDVTEGDIYSFGEVNIAGNTKTKEHVIRRELFTIPGNTFSRASIQESIRRLIALKYFSQESLAPGPGISIDEEDKEVDLTYTVEEVGSDQLELSGTYGRFGLVLQLRFTFNNFSMQNLFNWDAYRPLPTGDGQQLSLGIRTNGTYYQDYSISFTEPWFRGEPTPVGGSVSFQTLSGLPSIYGRDTRDSGDSFKRISTRVFYSQRLKWPDNKFMTSSAISYQYFKNDSLYDPRRIPVGVNNQVSFEQSLTRNSLDNPLFPSSGSKFDLSLEVAPPIGDLVQYYKVRFKTDWHVPLFEKLTLSLGTDYGYVGSLTGEPVQFGRFDVGGSPFDYGRYTYGQEQVFMRGYPASALNPRRNGQVIDGSILTKYTSELRFMAVQSQQLKAAPYLFLDAGKTWASFDTFNPFELYRSAGVGARLYLPIIGMIEVNYGLNFDRYLDATTPAPNDRAPRDWTFQISLGRSIQ